MRIGGVVTIIGIASIGGACRDDKPALAPAPAPVRAIATSRADARALDAPGPTAPACASSARAFRFGTLTAPAGWCWQRTEEGDDQSGILVDPAGATRVRYTELSFDEKVGDACDGKAARAVHDDRTAGVRYRTCELVVDGRHCASFHGRANVCTVLPESPSFTLADLLRTLAPKR